MPIGGRRDGFEIGTISFARCGEKMELRPGERVRLIAAAAAAYKPDLLVTAGYAVHSLKHLHRLARLYREMNARGLIVTEVHHDTVETERRSPHAMWAIHADGTVQRFGSQIFARMSEVASPSSNRLRRFSDALPDRVAQLGKRRVFALCCGELNIVQGREQPRYLCGKSADAIMAADIVINPTHDRMSNAGTLDAKRRLLSKPGPDGRERLYISCSNWEACGLNGRKQYPSPTLHTVYRSGRPVEGSELVADGKFGFVYQRWSTT